MRTKLYTIGILLLLVGNSAFGALVSNRYDTNSDAVAAALVNAQATAAANVVVNTNNTITPLGATLAVLFGASGATYLQSGGMTISNTATPAHPTVIGSDGGIHTFGYFDVDAGGQIHQLQSGGAGISAMLSLSSDVTYGIISAAGPGTPSYLYSIFTPFNNGKQTNATFPAGLITYNLDDCGQATWLFPKTGLYLGTWSTQPFLSWGVITSGVTNWSGYSFDGTTATLGPMTSTAGPVAPAFSWTQDTNNNLLSASVANGAITTTNFTTIPYGTNVVTILVSTLVTNIPGTLLWSNGVSGANTWLNGSFGGGAIWVYRAGTTATLSTNTSQFGVYTNSAGVTHSVSQVSVTNNVVVFTGNAAPFVSIQNPITLNTVYSNGYGVQLRGKIDYSLTDSAISGAPCILCTNFTRPWYTILSNNFVLAGVTYGAYKFDLEPAGTVLFTNLSSGSASATIFNSELHYP